VPNTFSGQDAQTRGGEPRLWYGRCHFPVSGPQLSLPPRRNPGLRTG
jgi:hypothetical protein